MTRMPNDAQTPHAIAFDFDGTLVDSAPGILRGMAQALDSQHIAPAVTLDRNIIGPPLRQTLVTVAGSDDPVLIAGLTRGFIRFYDDGACLDTPAFRGVVEVLTELRRRGHDLYLVTNKRGTPTRKILAHLGWTDLFKAVYCLDEHAGCPGKPQLLTQVLKAHALPPAHTPYIGDTMGDFHAATANAMPFIHAAWGYGDPPAATGRSCTRPEELLRISQFSS